VRPPTHLRTRCRTARTTTAPSGALRFGHAPPLRPPDRPPLADVAALAGYYDQAHFTRDWRDLAGCSPTTWLAEEFPSVQDTDPIDLAC